MTAPACWNCGYDLNGLPRRSPCPECGTPRPWLTLVRPKSDPAVLGLTLGILSIVLLFCLGPLAAVVAIPGAIVCYRRAGVRSTNRHESSGRNLAGIGLVLCIITIAFSILAAAAMMTMQISP